MRGSVNITFNKKSSYGQIIEYYINSLHDG